MQHNNLTQSSDVITTLSLVPIRHQSGYDNIYYFPYKQCILINTSWVQAAYASMCAYTSSVRHFVKTSASLAEEIPTIRCSAFGSS